MSPSVKLRTLSLLLMIALLTSVLAIPTDVAHAINTPWLSVSGRFIKDPQGNTVVLRGVSLVDVAVADSRPRNAPQLIDMVTNDADGWYARVVRLPVYPEAIDDTPGWNAGPDTYFNTHLNPAVQECVARQIYCIIDWHYISDYTSSAIDTSTRNFWSYVAPRYANTPNVIFELFNEPMNPDSWSTWKATAQPWVNLIRSYAPNNLILIGGPRWSQNLSSAASDPFTGSNLVYVAHIYPQHGGQSTWDSWFGNAANSAPFFVTEWGWQQGGGTPTSGTLSGYGIPFSTYLESKGLSWTAWVFDMYWQPVMFDLNYTLLGGENYMGQYTKDFLYQHRNDNLPGGGTGPTNTAIPTFTNTSPPSGNNTGWVSPSGQAAQSGGDGNGFQTSPTNAFADGGGVATDTNSGTGTSTSCTSTSKDRHAYFNYPISLPAGVSVTGIEVRLDTRVDSASGTRRFCVDASWNNGGSWTAMKQTANLSTTEASYILGSASDTWGRTWNANELTSSNFRVRITSVGSSTSRDFFLDWVPVRVSYSGGGGPTNTPTRTPTNTPITPGPSFTPTRTNTPITPIGPTTLRVQYRAADTNAGDNQIKPHFNIVNGGSSAIPLSDLKIRYWYTREGTLGQNFWCDYSAIPGSCSNVTGTFAQVSPARPGADFYLEVGFNAAAGSIAAGGQSGEIQTRFAKTDWSNYNEAGDYSFDPTKTSFTDWDHVTLYRNGSLVWGVEPGGGGPTNTPSATPTRTNTPSITPTGPTNTPTRTPTPSRTPTPTNTSTTPTFTPTRTPTNPPQGTHLDNPFVGAVVYRNVDYTASVNAAANLQGGTLGQQMRQVANYPTFVWLDSIDAVNGTNGYPRSLAGHMDAALAQGANAIELVIYDLPNRDCSALASNGELLIAQDGLNRYKTEYIDVIFNVISQAKYSNLRIIMIVESDSLPNLITNMSFAKCAEAAQPSKETGVYAQAFQYAIGKLRSINNTYAYIDVAHAAWLGWPSNFTPFVSLLKAVFKGVPGGNGKIDGFISNTANYNPVDEPYMDANTMINGQPVRSLQGWYDYNDYIDEGPYMAALYTALTTGSDAFPTSVGMIIDTSRNGWGGPNRPTGPSTSTDLRTFVMASRIDRRIHKGNWCNQDGAGIGARPAANPMPGIDAFVWVKPPGESDGSSTLVPVGPENPGGKGFDRMCDPTYTGNSLNGNSLTGALPNAPVSGRWFQAQFIQLVQNAFPAFQP